MRVADRFRKRGNRHRSGPGRIRPGIGWQVPSDPRIAVVEETRDHELRNLGAKGRYPGDSPIDSHGLNAVGPRTAQQIRTERVEVREDEGKSVERPPPPVTLREQPTEIRAQRLRKQISRWRSRPYTIVCQQWAARRREIADPVLQPRSREPGKLRDRTAREVFAVEATEMPRRECVALNVPREHPLSDVLQPKPGARLAIVDRETARGDKAAR